MAKAGVSIADIAAGQSAYGAVLNAIIRRGRTGEGDIIDISMLEAMVEWMGFPLYYAMDGAPPPPRAGAGHATIYPYGPSRQPMAWCCSACRMTGNGSNSRQSCWKGRSRR